jgi:hypothetical protein
LFCTRTLRSVLRNLFLILNWRFFNFSFSYNIINVLHCLQTWRKKFSPNLLLKKKYNYWQNILSKLFFTNTPITGMEFSNDIKIKLNLFEMCSQNYTANSPPPIHTHKDSNFFYSKYSSCVLSLGGVQLENFPVQGI